MDSLSDDLLIKIAVRVAAICREVAVSRAFGSDCIALLTDLCLTHEKLDFMNRLWAHGNHMFCILRCSQQLLHPMSRFDVINGLLTNVVAAHSLSVEYSHVLVKVTAYPLDNEVQLLNDLWALIMTMNLYNYRLYILGVLLLLGFDVLGSRAICPQAWFDAAFATTSLTAQEMVGGEIIMGFSLLMMKSMSTTISPSMAH